MVEYTKMMEVEDSNADGEFIEMRRMMQNKEIIRKFQGISAQELLYTSNEFHIKARDMEIEPAQILKCGNIGQNFSHIRQGRYEMI